MSLKMHFSGRGTALWLCTLLVLFAFAASAPAFAQVTGAVFTSEPCSNSPFGPQNCTVDLTLAPQGFLVNANTQYPNKTAVFLNGGPRNDNGAGLNPLGLYYFQVTDPSGNKLLSADPAACRVVDVVADGNGHGRVTGYDPQGSGCPDRLSFADAAHGGTPVQLCPSASGRSDTLGNGAPLFDANNWCDNTPNNGGVYKVFLIRYDHATVADDGLHLNFGNQDSQTDNFKIKQTTPPPCDPSDPTCNQNPPASISVCKFWDANADHQEDNGEVLLPGWTIDITNVDGNGASGSAVTGSDVSNYGCVSFNVGFKDGTSSTSVTLNEVLQANWNQTAPVDGTYSVSDGGTGNVSVTVAGGVQSLTVTPGQMIQLNDFGNTGFDLTVSKTANPSYTRTYNWNISKAVDKTKVDQIGGTVTFNYTVNAAETGFTDSNFAVSGVITVSNPNGFAVTGVNVSELGDGVGTCALTGNGSLLTVPANGSVQVSYTCTYAALPTVTGTNTAQATWSASTYNTPDGSATGTANYTFGAPTTTVNPTITVKDTFNGTTTTLGTLTATDTAPYASASYKYSHTVNVPTNNCVSYTNTAVIVETNQSDSKTVQVCGPVKTGALTMGFWQNKNGQAIITGGASVSNICKSGTWLRQYAPFQDLSSTATCAAVATYVSNVIKLATCSTSGTCNAMLKAQMLATALDVYFSDPALGGNKIGAPVGIGGVSIDLTKICHMIDGSGGTATCSGTYENVGPAFGGATSMTVSQMLAFAGSQSNAGGSYWYGQVKATQVLAKDAFDAINNQVAFAP